MKASLSQTHPELAAEWHPTKTGNLKPKEVTTVNRKKGWWSCPLGLKQARIPRPGGFPSPGRRRRTLSVLLREEQNEMFELWCSHCSLSYPQSCFWRHGGSEHPDSDFKSVRFNTAVRRPSGRRSAGKDSTPTNGRPTSCRYV